MDCAAVGHKAAGKIVIGKETRGSLRADQYKVPGAFKCGEDVLREVGHALYLHCARAAVSARGECACDESTAGLARQSACCFECCAGQRIVLQQQHRLFTRSEYPGYGTGAITVDAGTHWQR